LFGCPGGELSGCATGWGCTSVVGSATLTSSRPAISPGLEILIAHSDKENAAAITTLPAAAWTPALAADGGVRDKAKVAELTGLLTLTGWPAGMRVIVRRELPHPGAQLTLLEERDAWRTGSAAPKTPDCAAYPPASSPSTKPGVLPPRSPPASSAGCNYTPSVTLAKAEPKRLRYRLLHTAARLTRGNAAAGYAFRPPGPGPARSTPRSPE
jgi:hypothetical protein